MEDVQQEKEATVESKGERLAPVLPFEKPYVMEDQIDSFVLAWRPATIPMGELSYHLCH